MKACKQEEWNVGAAIGFGGPIFAEQQLGMWVELSAARFCLLSVLGTGRPRFGLYSAIRASHKSPLAALRYGQALISNPHSGTHKGRLWVALLCGALGEVSGDNVALEEHEKDNDWHDRDERTCQNESPITLHPPERTT